MGTLLHTQRQFNGATPTLGRFLKGKKEPENARSNPQEVHVKLHTDRQCSGSHRGPWSAVMPICNKKHQIGRIHTKVNWVLNVSTR